MPETFGPAFEGQSRPLLSYGLPFAESLAKHAEDTFHASRIYIICSKSLAGNTTYLNDLKKVLGDKVVGVRVGLKPHSLWSETLEIVADARESNSDLIVTLGAGSLTDSAKLVAFVCVPPRANDD